MLWRRWRSRDLRSTGERFRAEHSRFLSAALTRPEAYPRIPSKRVSEGGYDRLMASDSGREHTRRWWSIALERVGGA